MSGCNSVLKCAVQKLVQEMRNQRCMMVQNGAQFDLLLKMICYVAHERSKNKLDL